MKMKNPYFYALNPDILAYENAWVNYMGSGEINKAVISDDIGASWIKCSELNLDPFSQEPVSCVEEATIIGRESSNKRALTIIEDSLKRVFDAEENSPCAIMFCDVDGIVLRFFCDDDLRDRMGEMGIVTGARFEDSIIGTNSISQAIYLNKPVTVTGAEHYREMFHGFYSSSAPLTDSTGNLRGVISIWGRHEDASPHILGMLISCASSIQNEMQIKRINELLIENNNQLTAIFQSVPDGVVYIKDNRVVQMNDEMVSVIGKEKVINKNASDLIITRPEISSIINDERQNFDNFKATLYGSKKNYNCLVNKRTIIGADFEVAGQILIFIQVEEIKRLAKSVNKYSTKYSFNDIIGKSYYIRETIAIAKKATEHDATIIIEGESGTGKEMFAQAIHSESSRKNGAFVAVDCGAIPKELFESTLFGYEKGAFTGANVTGSIGTFESAQYGTVFFDEIENLPLDMQAKLLRVLQERTITRVGGNTPIYVNVRIIAATNENLYNLVEEGKFREDLYYRLNVVNIKIPPLRDRREDISELVENYLRESSIRNRRLKIEKAALDILTNYTWPGNVRQLYNAIERAEIMTIGTTIRSEDLPIEILESVEGYPNGEGKSKIEKIRSGLPLREAMNDYIRATFALNKNVSKTAKMLGITRPTVYKALKEGNGEKDNI